MIKRLANAYRAYARKPPVLHPDTGIIMYDSVTLSAIPHDAVAVAGYVNGHWPTYPSLVRWWKNAHQLSIAVSADADADCLDVEQGDAAPGEAPLWVKRQLKRGVYRPVVYSSVSQMPAVLAALEKAGVKRTDVRVWTAHYTGKPHRCTAACGFGFQGVADATQYDNRALRRNLDASLCAPGFFAKPPAPRKPKREPLQAKGTHAKAKGRKVIPPGTEKAA